MATIKSYTSFEQSKKLAEILPIESADMYYEKGRGIGGSDRIQFGNYADMGIAESMLGIKTIPCWSLAILLSTLTENKICHYDDRYYCQYMSKGDEFPIYSTAEYDNPVDACVEMIEKLHELNLL